MLLWDNYRGVRKRVNRRIRKEMKDLRTEED